MQKKRKSRRKEIIKIRIVINELENKVIQKINQTKSEFLEKSDKAVSGENDPGQEEGQHGRKKGHNYRRRVKNLSENTVDKFLTICLKTWRI